MCRLPSAAARGMDVADTRVQVFSARWNEDNRGYPQFPIGETRGASHGVIDSAGRVCET